MMEPFATCTGRPAAVTCVWMCDAELSLRCVPLTHTPLREMWPSLSLKMKQLSADVSLSHIGGGGGIGWF